MRFVGDVVDRLLRDWLTPPDEQPIRTKLSVAMDTSTDTLTYDPLFLAPEAAELVGPGTIVEVDREQIIIGDVNEGANQFTNLIRRANGTIATNHAVGAEVIVAPTWPRQTVFEALSDSIINLYPELYRVDHLGPFANQYFSLPDDVQDVTDVYRSTAYGLEHVGFQFNDYDPRFGYPSIYAHCSGPSIYATVNRKFEYPERESQSLKELGIQQEWEQLIIIGTLAYLIGKEDFDPVTVESISEAIDAQGFPVRSGSAIRDSIIAYYEYLMARARRVQLNKFSDTVLQKRGI